MPLLIDPHSAIIPVKGSLHIFSRQGVTTVKADQIEEVHRRVSRHLNDQYTRRELLSAVPAGQQSVLARYLDGLADAAVLLRTARPATAVATSEVQKASAHCVVIRMGATVACVQLKYGPLDCDIASDIRILFLTAHEMNVEWQLFWQSKIRDSRSFYIIVEDVAEVDEAELHRRYHHAMWLLSCLGAGPRKKNEVRIY